MTFDQVLPDFKAGKKIRRREWDKGDYFILGGVDIYVFLEEYSTFKAFRQLDVNQILADDWEVVE